MSFIWPWALLDLLLLVVAVWGYRRLVRNRDRRRQVLAEQGIRASGSPSGRSHRRWLPPALFLTALTLLLVALARPEATVAEPRREGTIVLGFDTSNSMRAEDLQPSRLAAAQEAARTFVDAQPAEVRLAVVAFSDNGLATQQPTLDRAAVRAAIDRLTVEGPTSLSRGIQASLTAIAGRPVTINDPNEESTQDGDDIGHYANAAIVLFTDGQDSGAQDPLVAAETAALAGVKIHPIGIGTPEGTTVEIDGYSLATALDEPLLKEIATTTGGGYHAADDAEALKAVYSSIDLGWIARPTLIEITGLLAATAALVLAVGAGLSVAWHGRVI